MFCRETVRDTRRSSEADTGFPRTVFVHVGGAEARKRFFDEFWPDAAVIDDPERELYQAFGLGRGNLRELFGLDVWKAGLRAIGKGESLGIPRGNVLVMPGMFIADLRGILWSHEFQHAGDEPGVDVIRAAADAWS